MPAQTTYSFKTTAGVPGGIYDLSPYAIDEYANEENTGVMKFGMGVVRGTGANSMKLPVSASGSADFLGVTVNGRTTEYDLEGNIHILNKASVGIMRYGKIYARVVSGLAITPGSAVYLITSGDNVGLFTNTSGANTIAVNAIFVSAADANCVAPVEIYNAPVNVPSYELPTASASTLGGVKVGTGLKITDGVLSIDE